MKITIFFLRKCLANGIVYYKILLFYLFYETLHTYIAILVSYFGYYLIS